MGQIQDFSEEKYNSKTKSAGPFARRERSNGAGLG